MIGEWRTFTKLKLVLSAILFNAHSRIKSLESRIFWHSTVLIHIYFVQLIYSFYDNDDEPDDDKYFFNFIYIEILCNMQFVTLNVLTYIFGVIDSITFSQNDILTE